MFVKNKFLTNMFVRFASGENYTREPKGAPLSSD